MKQDFKNKEQRERRAYVPAVVRTIEISSHKVICISGTQTEQMEEGSTDGWYD